MNLPKQWIVISVATLVTLPLFGFLYLYIAFSGGINCIIRKLKTPDVQSATVTRDRTAMKNAIMAAFDAFEAGTGFAAQAASTHDRCHYKEECNWKVKGKHPYAHRCAVRVTRFYGMDGGSPRLMSFETLLRKNNLALSTAYAAKEAINLGRINSAQYIDGRYIESSPLQQRYDSVAIYDRKELQDVNAVFEKVTKSSGYMVVISIQGSYLEK